VSEYQYFEFRAIDRPLDEQAQRDLHGISSRASITATSFTNTYNWGDLRADPARMLARWFDALLHVTNWGTRWLAFRVPCSALSADVLMAYEEELFSSRREGEHLCLHFLLEDEDPGNWIDGDQCLSSLLPLREALGAGDLRSLYLAWLVDVQRGGVEEEDVEPPVPPGLRELDGAHRSFVEFMQVDRDLLAVAAEASDPLAPVGPSAAATRAWLGSLDVAQKDRWLVRVLEGDGARLRWELRKRLRDGLDDGAGREQEPRTAGSLVERGRELADQRMRQAKLERAERQRREAERRAAARQRHLDELAGREPELWTQVDELIATLKPKAYDEAVALVTDLRDLAERSGDRVSWDTRLASLRTQHARKSSLLRRLDRVLTPASAHRRGR
jgi:hypothetical protein